MNPTLTVPHYHSQDSYRLDCWMRFSFGTAPAQLCVGSLHVGAAGLVFWLGGNGAGGIHIPWKHQWREGGGGSAGVLGPACCVLGILGSHCWSPECGQNINPERAEAVPLELLPSLEPTGRIGTGHHGERHQSPSTQTLGETDASWEEALPAPAPPGKFNSVHIPSPRPGPRPRQRSTPRGMP